MSTKKQKLELTWIGKENRPKLEPRILLEDPAKSYHAQYRVKTGLTTENTQSTKEQGEIPSLSSLRSLWLKESGDLFDNKLIHGDNLLALKALEQEFSGKVKCIFIDPPYNTGSAFEHYDDGVEHSIWLSLMRDLLELLRDVTTQHLTREQLTQLNDEVGANRSLLVCCAAFRGKAEDYPQLELKKIPKAVLSKCEWGHDDYSLKVENLPKAPPKPGQQDLF